MRLQFKRPNDNKIISYVYQYDTGVLAEFKMDNIPCDSDIEIAFINANMTEAICKKVSYNSEMEVWICRVPDVMLLQSLNIQAYLCFIDTDRHRRTIDKTEFIVAQAPKPANYVSTDNDQFISLEQLIEEIKGVKIELKKEENVIKWRYTNSDEWTTLYTFDELFIDIDDSLTKSGMAADAKVVGDMFREMSTATLNLKKEIGNKYEKPETGIPETDLSQDVKNKLVTEEEKKTWDSTNKSLERLEKDLEDKYSKPETGIPETDLSQFVKDKLVSEEEKKAWNDKSDFSGDYNDLENLPTIPEPLTEADISRMGFTKNTGTYSKPETGIPESDLSQEVQEKLGNAEITLDDAVSSESENAVKNNAIAKAIDGMVEIKKETPIKIPDKGEIDRLDKRIDDVEKKKVGYSEVINGQLLMYSDDTKEYLLATLDLPSGGVSDVTVNSTSIVDEDGKAKIQLSSDGGLMLSRDGALTGQICISKAQNSYIKYPGESWRSDYAPITPSIQHRSVFYGLATAAGDITMATSSNSVGQYTDEAKTAIQQMLGIYPMSEEGY